MRASRQIGWSNKSNLLYNILRELNSIKGRFVKCSECSTPPITIGLQRWATCNLTVTKYANGDDIPQVTDQLEWVNLTTGAWCYVNNDPSTECIYGKLYNWYAVSDPRGLMIPAGYAIPTAANWNELITSLGGSAVAGGAMKSLDTWNAPNTGATNSSGFTALAAGIRNDDYVPGDPIENYFSTGNEALFWTTSLFTGIFLSKDNAVANQDITPDAFGGSVRLISYVPFTPLPPEVDPGTITITSVGLSIGFDDGNPSNTEYAIQDLTTGLYVNAVGSLQATPEYLVRIAWGTTIVTGLFPNTLCQFRAIARDPISLITTPGPVLQVTTLTPSSPYIASRPVDQFIGDTPVSTPSAIFSFVFQGYVLDGTDVVIDSVSFDTGLQSCNFSTNPLGPFTPTITYSGYGTDIPLTTIYYTYTPGVIGPEQGGIFVDGGGAGNGLIIYITGI